MSYLNSEHYYDPTAGQAMENVVREARRIRADAEVMIGMVSNPDAQTVLIRHYLDGMSLRKIGREIKYSDTQALRFRNLGLEELEGMLAEQN